MHIFSPRPSNGANFLSAALGVRKARADGPQLRTNVLINWGASELPNRFNGLRVLNTPEAIQVASNKLAFFEAIGDNARTPEWMSSRDQAVAWRDRGDTVVARTLLRASGGDGIVICEPGGVDIPHAPLYTKYVPKTHEYRIHCAKNRQSNSDEGNWFYGQRKVRRPGDPEPVTWKVRNLANGFIYQSEDLDNIPGDVKFQAHNAFIASGLDFGAVDVMWHERRGLAYVLEINTAPGLTEASAQRYAEAIRAMV